MIEALASSRKQARPREPSHRIVSPPRHHKVVPHSNNKLLSDRATQREHLISSPGKHTSPAQMQGFLDERVYTHPQTQQVR